MMATIKPVHASDSIPRTTLWCSHQSNPASCIYSTKEAACNALAVDNPGYNYNPFILLFGGNEVSGHACYGHPANRPNDNYWAQRLGWLITGSACPLNSTPETSTSCTCNDSYVPDSSGTSCVKAPEVICPIPELPKPPYPGDTDQACTASLEKGRGNDIDLKCRELTDEMKDEAKCLADKIHALAIPYSGPSATVRTTAYQQHLLDVWKGKNMIADEQEDLSDAEKQVCAATIADIEAHVNHHKIKSKPSDNGEDAPHVLRQAIDIPSAVIDAMIARVTNKTVVIPATCSLHCSPAVVYYRDVEDYINSTAINPPACNLRWGGRFNPYDAVHFQIP